MKADSSAGMTDALKAVRWDGEKGELSVAMMAGNLAVLKAVQKERQLTAQTMELKLDDQWDAQSADVWA